MAEDLRVARGPHDKHAVHARIVERLQGQVEDVTRMVAGLSEPELARRTVPDKWSVKELICHLDRIQEVFDERVEAMLGQENPKLPPYEPDGDPGFDERVRRTTVDTLASFRMRRERLIARLEELRPADWHRPGRHPEYANYDVHFCVEYLAHHEAHHLYQMFQRRAPLGAIPH
jgi:DinB family protein